MMHIKQTYSYFLKENLKATGIIYSIVVGVTFLVFLLVMMLGETFSFSDIQGLIPNYFTVYVVSFIFTLVTSRNVDLICNQFGKSRETSFISNLLVMISISFVVALLFSILNSIFYKSQYQEFIEVSAHFKNVNINNKSLFIGSDVRYASLFSYWLYSLSYYTFISIAASALGIFIYSLWVRLEKLYRWIVFLFIPVVLAYAIPKAIIENLFGNQKVIQFFKNCIHFFGLENGFSYQFIFVSLLVIILPLLILAFFIMRKKPLYGKKK
ncbi:MAG: hypothetical protein PQJ49_04745 [Sphaerochaetaceae bacterium]|nr:hypothetical protein [Sphaerochaetaceae bacterium]